MNPSSDALEPWLLALDGLPLECDGLTRVVSALLTDVQVPHQMYAGSLVIEGVGAIPLHWWVSLPGGMTLDLRARMWLGDDECVPHGSFQPSSSQRYVGNPQDGALPRVVLDLMTGRPLAALPPVPHELLAIGATVTPVGS